MKNLEEYLSIKFQRPITQLSNSIKKSVYSGGRESRLFSYDSKRVLKIENFHDQKKRQQISLYEYLKNNGNDLPIAKIYNFGYINIPKKQDFGSYDSKFIYIIMEKINIDQELLDELIFINKYGKDIVRDFYDDQYIFGRSSFLQGLSLTESDKMYNDILEAFNESEVNKILINELINICKTFRDNDIQWWDIHPGQFGRNIHGELVAIDIDGFEITNNKKIMKTHIKESKYIKTFESFNGTIVQDEIVDLIQGGKKIYVKFIEDYPEHDNEQSYVPVDIDDEGNITLDIDGDLYYTKYEWIEGVDETVSYYEVEPEMTEPEKEEGSAEVSWKKDKEFLELVKTHGGRKGVIKRMKRKFNIDYSDCKTYQDLYVSLKSDGM